MTILQENLYWEAVYKMTKCEQVQNYESINPIKYFDDIVNSYEGLLTNERFNDLNSIKNRIRFRVSNNRKTLEYIV